MLVLFFGVSGVGKTTLMDALAINHQWKYVPTYTTRVLRSFEQGKIFVEKSTFFAKQHRREFLCVNALFGNLYGTPVAEINEAVRDVETVWMMDFPISRRAEIFSTYPHLGVIIMPETEEQLRRQLCLSGRKNRLAEVLEDYRSNYLPLCVKIRDQHNLRIVITHYDLIPRTLGTISDLVTDYFSAPPK
jgi:guanylate kinase